MRLVPLLGRLRSTYWFLPFVVTAVAIVAAELLIAVDRQAAESTLGWVYGGGADGARSLLAAIAGSIITVVSVTFSVLVVALTVSSQHFGPRVLNNLMRDRSAQLMLGAFTGTFAYCLMTLRTVHSDGSDRSVFVPHLAVTGAVVLALLSVAALIYYIHHVAASLLVSNITMSVGKDLERAIARLYPERFGERSQPATPEPPPVPENSVTVPANQSGYIQGIDSDRVMNAAVSQQITIWLNRRPGDFVIEGSSIAAVHPRPQDADKLRRALAAAYVFGADRTSHQDAAFAVQQLVEVALRALSPGVNEPFTALACIDRVSQGLAKMLERKIPSATRCDDEGHLRVVARPRVFAELLEAACEPLAIYGGRNPAIGGRLLETLAELAEMARRPEDRAAIGRTADRVWRLAITDLPDERYRQQLTDRRREVGDALADGRRDERSSRSPQTT
jgi:uncharacterized membrane protein